MAARALGELGGGYRSGVAARALGSQEGGIAVEWLPGAWRLAGETYCECNGRQGPAPHSLPTLAQHVFSSCPPIAPLPPLFAHTRATCLRPLSPFGPLLPVHTFATYLPPLHGPPPPALALGRRDSFASPSTSPDAFPGPSSVLDDPTASSRALMPKGTAAPPSGQPQLPHLPHPSHPSHPGELGRTGSGGGAPAPRRVTAERSGSMGGVGGVGGVAGEDLVARPNEGPGGGFRTPLTRTVCTPCYRAPEVVMSRSV